MSATFNVYRRESNDTNPPVAIATGLTSKEYSDATAIEGKSYLYSVGAIVNSVEKISDELLVKTIGGASGLLASLFDSAEKGFAYNFQDLSTLWQDVAGTIPVTAVDQFIARIDDISGNGNHLIQENSAKRPQLKQDAEGYYAWFDGTKSMYTADVVDTSTLLNFAYIVRMTKEVSNTAIVLESSINFNSNQPSFAVLQDNNNISVAKSGYDYTTASVLLDNDSLILSNFDLSLSGSKIPVLRINGVEKARTNVLNGASLALGGFRVYVGARAGTSLYLTSRVRALSFVGRMLTTQEITDVESVLMS